MKSPSKGQIRLFAAAAALTLAAAAPAFAHHSFAQFDMTKVMTLSGVVRTFEWRNPHTWLWIEAPDDKGGSQVWGIEGTAPGDLGRHGWSKTMFKPGDKVSLKIHPLRDGRPGGSFGPDGLGLSGLQAH